MPNRKSPPAILIRESYRENGRVRKRTLANLSKLPAYAIEALEAAFQGGTVFSLDRLRETLEITRTWQHGHVAAALGSLRRCELETLIASQRSRNRDLVTAMIVARLLDPQSKYATACRLDPRTTAISLGTELSLGNVTENELYEAMDWLLAPQTALEKRLSQRHLTDGDLVLYDVSSTWFEGRTCPLARYGHSRDGKRHRLPLVFGLLCDQAGRPIAVEAFPGNTGDPATVASQITKLRQRFGLSRVALVGDRGRLTEARIQKDLKPAGIDWISALRKPAIRKLTDQGLVSPEWFDDRHLAAIECEEWYPGKRLIVCRNPFLAEECQRKREDLLQATEQGLRVVTEAIQRPKRAYRGKERIQRRVDKVLDKHRMRKHFLVTIADDSLTWQRRDENIRKEAALDGNYLIRTSLPATQISDEKTVQAYKNLSSVERAFRGFKASDLRIRPIPHRTSDRVKAHLSIGMLAYYVERHMRELLAPLIFADEEKPQRKSPVNPARSSSAARKKAASKQPTEGLPVQDFRGVFQSLSSLAKQQVRTKITGSNSFSMLTTPTALQNKALELLGVSLKIKA